MHDPATLQGASEYLARPVLFIEGVRAGKSLPLVAVHPGAFAPLEADVLADRPLGALRVALAKERLAKL
jgi:hypothetical protein